MIRLELETEIALGHLISTGLLAVFGIGFHRFVEGGSTLRKLALEGVRLKLEAGQHSVDFAFHLIIDFTQDLLDARN